MIQYLLFFAGLIILIKSADYLVESSSSLARKAGISTLVIGLTIIAFGTSLPELMVNVMAALRGVTEIAYGNIVGSSIANILLVLGFSAVILKIKIQHSTVWREIPFALIAASMVFILSSVVILGLPENSYIFRIHGIFLLIMFSIFLFYVFNLAKKNRKQFSPEKMGIKKISSGKIALMMIGGFIGLYVGGRWTVDGAVAIARFLGVSEYLISLTIISIGTSLPELVTSIVAGFKKEVDLAVGNIVGSNIFNIFWVLGITAVISPIKLPGFAFVDATILLLASTLLFTFMFLGKKHELQKSQGAFLFLMYVFYIAYLLLRKG